MFTLLCLTLTLLTFQSVHPARTYTCLGSDCVVYGELQGTCKEVTQGPISDCRWKAGLYPYTDIKVLNGGKIAAYKIEWSTGWSGWFVPGVNDIDWKFNPTMNPACLDPVDNSTRAGSTLRRLWSYFYDHAHKYIVCYNAWVQNKVLQNKVWPCDELAIHWFDRYLSIQNKILKNKITNKIG